MLKFQHCVNLNWNFLIGQGTGPNNGGFSVYIAPKVKKITITQVTSQDISLKAKDVFYVPYYSAIAISFGKTGDSMSTLFCLLYFPSTPYTWF